MLWVSPAITWSDWVGGGGRARPAWAAWGDGVSGPAWGGRGQGSRLPRDTLNWGNEGYKGFRHGV